MNQVMPMSETNLPQDPKDGDIVVSPDGSPVGYLDEMTVWQNDHVIGTAQSISRVENVSFKAIMVGCTSNKDLYPQDKIRVVITRYTYDAMQYTELYGWGLWNAKGPCKTDTLFSTEYTVDKTLILMQTNGLCYYGQIYLNKEEKKNAPDAPQHDGPEAASDSATGT